MNPIEEIRDLLIEIRDALIPEPVAAEVTIYSCMCAKNGVPVSNCPLCSGTGSA